LKRLPQAGSGQFHPLKRRYENVAVHLCHASWTFFLFVGSIAVCGIARIVKSIFVSYMSSEWGVRRYLE
jgi:hypothetical protein